MKKLTDEQIAVMRIAEQSLPKLKSLAERASKANLNILGKELEVMEKDLKGAIEYQARSFREPIWFDPKPLFPDDKEFPYGRHSGTSTNIKIG